VSFFPDNEELIDNLIPQFAIDVDNDDFEYKKEVNARIQMNNVYENNVPVKPTPRQRVHSLVKPIVKAIVKPIRKSRVNPVKPLPRKRSVKSNVNPIVNLNATSNSNTNVKPSVKSKVSRVKPKVPSVKPTVSKVKPKTKTKKNVLGTAFG
jgi:hypothetical protein